MFLTHLQLVPVFRLRCYEFSSFLNPAALLWIQLFPESGCAALNSARPCFPAALLWIQLVPVSGCAAMNSARPCFRLRCYEFSSFLNPAALLWIQLFPESGCAALNSARPCFPAALLWIQLVPASGCAAMNLACPCFIYFSACLLSADVLASWKGKASIHFTLPVNTA